MNWKYFIVFLISMVPLIELRGAIPYAVGFGLPIAQSCLVAVVGNMLPVPFIFFFARRFLEWGKDVRFIGGFCSWCLGKGEKARKKLSSGRGLYVALLLFVGIPLPGTGAWTGTLAASFLNMDFKKSIAAVMGGVLLAGAIMLAASFGLFEAIKAIF